MRTRSIRARLAPGAITLLALLLVDAVRAGQEPGDRPGPTEASVERLEQLQAASRDAEASPQERRHARDALIEVRRTLIDTRPDDPRRPSWLADQAEDLVLGVLPADGATLATLVGVPTRAQRELVAATAGEALDLIDAAASGFVGLDRRAATRPEIDDVERRQLQRRYAAQRETRLPMLRGIAQLLRAATIDDDAAAVTLRRAAAETLEDLAARLNGAEAARAATHAGLARWALGDDDAARRWFERTAGNDEAHRSDRFVAELARASIDDEDGGTLRAFAARYDDPALLRYRILVADREHLHALRSSGDEVRRIRRAVGAYERLLEIASDAPLDALRTLLLDKLAMSLPDDVAAADLPPLARVARAKRLRETERASEAAELLETTVERDALEPAVQGAALLLLGRALLDAGRRGDAVDRWTQLARELPADPAAEMAVRLAATVAAAEWATRPVEPSVRTRLRTALALLLDRYPNLADLERWRLLAGRLALAEERFDDARVHFEAVGRDAEGWLDAQYLAVVAMKSAWDAADRVDRVELTPPLMSRADQLRRTLSQARDADEQAARYRALTRAVIAELQLEQGLAADALATLGPPGADPAAVEHDDVLAADVRLRLAAARDPATTETAFADLAAWAAIDPAAMGRALEPLLRERIAVVERLRGKGRDDEADAIATRELGRLADLVMEVIGDAEADTTDALHAVADALRLSGRCVEALPRYDRLLADEPNALPYLLGRAECLFEIGGEEELAAAIGIFKRIATLGPQRGGDAYWRAASLRTLQILDRVGRNRDRIAPQIERLRRLDPELGGDRWRRGFERLARTAGESRR